LDVKKSDRDHAHLFLSENASILSLSHEEFVELFESRRFTDFRPTHIIELEGQLVGVPLDSGGGFGVRHIGVIEDSLDLIFHLLQSASPVLVNRVDPEADIERVS
jgi:hypothetical protein